MRNNKILSCMIFSLCLFQLSWGLEYKENSIDSKSSSALTAYIENENPLYLVDINSQNKVTDTWDYNEVKTLHLDVNFSSMNNQNKFVAITLPLGMKLNSSPDEYINGVTIESVDKSKFGVDKITLSNSTYTPKCGTVKFNVTEKTQSLSIDLIVSIDDKFWNTVNGVIANEPSKNAIEIEVGDSSKSVKHKLDTIYTTGRNWSSYADVNISDYVQTGTSVYVSSYVTMDYVQSTRDRIYNEVLVKMDIPYTIKTENGVSTKKYAEVKNISVSYGGTYEIKDNQIIVKCNNALLSRVSFSLYLNFDENIFKENDLVTFKYGEIWVKDYFNKQSYNIRSSSTKNIYIAKSTENVKISSSSISAFNNKNENVVSHLGYFLIKNDGAESSSKRIIFDFPYGSNSGVGVTTIRIPTTIEKQTISIEYILWDRSTNKEYSGTVSINKPAAANVYEGYLLTVSTIKNSIGLTNKELYFKQIKYLIGKIPFDYQSYARQSSHSTASSGNVWGKVFLNTEANQSYSNKMSVESLDNNGSVVNTIYTSSNTYISSSGQVPVYVNAFNYYDNSGKVISEVNSGRDFNLKGNFSIASYPYTNTGYMSNPIILIKVPKGITINKNYTRFYSSKNTTKDLEYEIINSSNPRELSNGEVVYEIAITNEGLGNYTESLSLINYINFEIRLNIGKTVKTMSLNGRGLISIEDKFVKANAGGAYDAWYIIDQWDVNNNGATTDKLATVRNDIFLNINSNTNCLDTDFFISINNGEYTRDSVTLTSPNDTIKLKFSIDNIHEGYVLPGEFEYTITIPKEDTASNGFSLELIEFVEETDGFEILYSSDRIDFIEKNKVNKLNEVKYVKIKSTKKIEDNYKHDFILNVKYTANSYNKKSFKISNIVSGYQTYRKGTSSNSIYQILDTIYTFIDSNQYKPTILKPIKDKLYSINEPVNINWIYTNTEIINKATINLIDSNNKIISFGEVDRNTTNTLIKVPVNGVYKIIITSFNKFGIASQSEPMEIRVGIYKDIGYIITKELSIDSQFNYIALLASQYIPEGTSISARAYFQADSKGNVIVSDKEGYYIDVPLYNKISNYLIPTKIPKGVSKVKVKFILKNNTKPYKETLTPILENIKIFVK